MLYPVSSSFAVKIIIDISLIIFFLRKKLIFFFKKTQFYKRNKINVIYNVHYHPEFNPIERVFSKLKFLIRRKNNINKNCLVKNVKQAFKKITEENLNNFYKKIILIFKKIQSI